MYQNTTPAAYWQNQLYEWGPRVLLAILILVATHFVAKAVQWGLAKIINRVPLLKRDPQVASGPLALALADMATLLLYFNLARWLLA